MDHFRVPTFTVAASICFHSSLSSFAFFKWVQTSCSENPRPRFPAWKLGRIKFVKLIFFSWDCDSWTVAQGRKMEIAHTLSEANRSLCLSCEIISLILAAVGFCSATSSYQYFQSWFSPFSPFFFIILRSKETQIYTSLPKPCNVWLSFLILLMRTVRFVGVWSVFPNVVSQMCTSDYSSPEQHTPGWQWPTATHFTSKILACWGLAGEFFFLYLREWKSILSIKFKRNFNSLETLQKALRLCMWEKNMVTLLCWYFHYIKLQHPFANNLEFWNS